MHTSKPARIVIVDESVSDGDVMRFKKYADERGLETAGYQLIRQLYPAMPDGQIIRHLLNSTTILITTDRPFHNTVLSQGLASYYLGNDAIIGTPLPGISLKANVEINKKQALLTNYLPVMTEIRPLLLPDSPQQLKKLRTKCRRIRNHFDGLQNLQQVAVTVSWHPLGSRVLIGVRIQVSSNSGVKALEASESYTAESLSADYCSIASLSYALILVIQLMLNSVKTVVYFDSTRINRADLPATLPDNHMHQDLFARLSKSFEQLEYVPVSKGQHLESLRRKLTQLVNSRDTNEIQQDSVKEILRSFAEKGAGTVNPDTEQLTTA